MTATGGGHALRVYSSGWFYAENIPAIVAENIPDGKPALIDDQGRYGYPVYSSGGYCVQMLADVATLEKTKAAFAFEAIRAKHLRLFEMVQDQTNWKLPTHAWRTTTRAAAQEMADAISFFVGGAEISHDNVVTSRGYYFYSGA